MGDGVLIEFASAVEAVQCAVGFQEYLTAISAEAPTNDRISYRIGINIGDIVVEKNDIFGDGVNIAARLESIAEPGGINVALNVYEAVRDKLDVNFETLGGQQLKNIDDPVQVYRLIPDEKAKILAESINRQEARPESRRKLIAFAAILAALIGAAAWWQPWQQWPLSTASSDGIPLPGKPSIAVMAFDNLNNDPKLDYLSDGLSENILTALSRFPDFFVIARNSTFSYKDQPVDVKQVARELGVRYVVQGSVQIAGDMLRATAQLIDATSAKKICGRNSMTANCRTFSRFKTRSRARLRPR